MTHWWALPAVVAILVAMWVVAMLTEALEKDRRWSRLRSGGLGTLVVFGLYALLVLATPAWGQGRRITAVLVSYLLLAIGEVAHELHSDKRLLSLPKKS